MTDTKKQKPTKLENKDSKKKVALPKVVAEDSEFIEELKKLDGDDGLVVKAMSVMMHASRSYSGPLPSAEQFKIYEDTCPGAGNRILTSMEQEQAWRHKMDEKALASTLSDTNKGQNYGFFIMLSLVIGAVVCGVMGNNLVGVALVAAAAVNVVRKFIDGRSHPKPRNNEGK